MKYKEFVDWCNQRACDGCWSMNTAMICIDIMESINKLAFWKREKVWKAMYEKTITNEIIEPIDKKMKELGIIQ